MSKDKRFCININQSLSRAIGLSASEKCQTQAEFIRQASIELIITSCGDLDPQVRQFVLEQVHQSLLEMGDTELNSLVKKRLMALLTPLLIGAR